MQSTTILLTPPAPDRAEGFFGTSGLPFRRRHHEAVEVVAYLDLARQARVRPHVEAECGGACACATCHVYVDEAWREKTGAPSPMEEDMLDFGFDVRPNSRLSCQIKVSDELDGLIVSTPERQA